MIANDGKFAINAWLMVMNEWLESSVYGWFPRVFQGTNGSPWLGQALHLLSRLECVWVAGEELPTLHGRQRPSSVDPAVDELVMNLG